MIKFTGGKISGVGGDVVRSNDGTPDVQFDGTEISDVQGSFANILEPPKPVEDGGQSPAEHWHKKPIGILGLAVAGGLLVAASLWSLAHYFG